MPACTIDCSFPYAVKAGIQAEVTTELWPTCTVCNEGCGGVGSCYQYAGCAGVCAQHHTAEADGDAAGTAPRGSATVRLLRAVHITVKALIMSLIHVKTFGSCPGVVKDMQLL